MASDLNLDAAAFGKCLDTRKFRAAVEADYRTGGELGVNATPAFFINGRFLSGAQPFDEFRAIIDDEIGN